MLIQDANTVRAQSAVNEKLRDTVRLPKIVNLEDVATELRKRQLAANFSKLRLYANAYQNQMFFLGQQWVYMRGLTPTDVENPDGEIRVTANRIAPNVRLLLGMLSGAQTKVEPIPTTNQTRDKQFALIARSLLEFVGRINHRDRLQAESDELRVMHGTSCVRTYLDPKGGQPMTVQLPGREPMTVQFPEIRKEVYSIFHSHVFPTRIKTPRDARAVMFDARRPLEELRELWPKFADQIKEETQRSPYDTQMEQMDRLFSPSAERGAISGYSGTGTVTEYYELPCGAWPQGRRVVKAGDVVVELDVNPFCGLFPPEAPATLALGCVFLRGIIVPGEFWGIGFPEAAIPPQVTLNRIKTDQAMNRLTMGRDRLLAQRGTLDAERLNNAYGAVWEYDPDMQGRAPVVVHASALPGASQEIVETLKDIDDAFGMYDIMRGLNEGNVRSDAHFLSLLESGNRKFVTLTNEREMADADDARITLALVRAHYPPEKITRIVGEEKRFALTLVKNQDIYADVEVVRGSAMPRNSAAWNAQMMELWRNGALVDEYGRPDVERLNQNLDLGGMRHESPNQAHIDSAQSENADLEMGQLPVPKPWHDHILHNTEHKQFLVERENLPPIIQQRVLLHMDWHRMAMIQPMLPQVGFQPTVNSPLSAESAASPSGGAQESPASNPSQPTDNGTGGTP